MSDPEVTREKPAVDNEPSEVDVKVDAALGDLVRCAYHDRWLRARLQIVEDGIRALRAENEALRIDLAAAFCPPPTPEGFVMSRSHQAAPVRRYAYTPAEFATTLGVCRATVYNMITRGELRFVKLGRSTRIPAAELDRLLGVSSGGSAA